MHNTDGARKRQAIKDLVLARGGGLLMFVDADDWVDTRLVATTRAHVRPRHIGAVIDTGYVLDVRTLRAAHVPDRKLFDGGLHRICGSTAVLRLDSDAAQPLRRDPYRLVAEHHRFVEATQESNVLLLHLDLDAC